MSLNILAISDLLAFSQGLLLGLLFLCNYKGSRYANVLLGLFILVFNFSSLHSFFLNSGLVNQHIWLLGFPSLFVFWFGPLLYFYTHSLTETGFTWKRSYYWWFAPALVELGGNFIILCLKDEQLIMLAYSEYFTWGAAIHSFTASLLAIYCVLCSLRLIQKSANLSAIKLKWLKYILSYFLVRFAFWSLYFALVFALVSYINVASYTNSVVGFFATMDFVAVFAISIFSFRHMHNMHASPKEAAYTLTPDQEELYFGNLLHLMQQEKIYRQTDLKINEVAALLNTNVKYTSQLIKSRTGSSFTNFVNTYRIDEIKSRIVDEQYRHLTMLAIAEESGFSSKATFNRVFKEIAGVTPKAYREQHLQQTA